MSDINLKAFSPDGFLIHIKLDIDTPADIPALLDQIRSIGLAATPPEQVNGDRETIATVMRRQKADGTPIIDFFPSWAHNGAYGQHKFAHLYLDTDADRAEFEAQSGLRLADIPVYESDRPLKRNMAKPHKDEVTVKRAFDMARIADGAHETGMPKYKYQYAIPLGTRPDATPPPAPRAPMPVPTSTLPLPTPAADTPTRWPAGDWDRCLAWLGKKNISTAEALSALGLKNWDGFPSWNVAYDVMVKKIGGTPARPQPIEEANPDIPFDALPALPPAYKGLPLAGLHGEQIDIEAIQRINNAGKVSHWRARITDGLGEYHHIALFQEHKALIEWFYAPNWSSDQPASCHIPVILSYASGSLRVHEVIGPQGQRLTLAQRKDLWPQQIQRIEIHPAQLETGDVVTYQHKTLIFRKRDADLLTFQHQNSSQREDYSLAELPTLIMVAGPRIVDLRLGRINLTPDPQDPNKATWPAPALA